MGMLMNSNSIEGKEESAPTWCASADSADAVTSPQ